MILRLAAIVLFAGLSGWANAQAFTENFDDISLLMGMGWFMQNNSAPIGSMPTWFQGTPTTATPTPGPFDAFNGARNAYIAANFSNTAGSGTISNWLAMPNRTLRNGDVVQFYTRKPTISAGGTDYPDRLEVRLSTNGASTNVGTGPGDVGDFSTLMLSINPTLVPNVYPQVWTQFTVTVSGLPAPTSGRMAFRYYVTNGGPLGTSSDYIGIDNAVYSPYVCPAFTMTPGGALSGGLYGQAYSTTLTQTGALGAPNFTVTAGALPPGLSLASSGVISGTPYVTGTFNFTVTVSDASGCSGSQSYSITLGATVPGAPQVVAATAGDARIDVTWNPPSSDGGDPIIGYSATCTDGANASSATGPVPPITVTGLTNGNPHTCTVAAYNSVGQGPASAPSNSVTPMGNQTITFPPQPAHSYSEGGTFPIDPPATASSGLPVSYASQTPSVCTISGSTVSMLAAGTCLIEASQPGDASYLAAPSVTQPIDIGQGSQTITFPPQTAQTYSSGGTFAIDPPATASSGLAVSYASQTSSVCTISGSTVSILSAGSCMIEASQAGDANYMAAPAVTRVITIDQASQTITFPSQADQTYSSGGTFAIDPPATASSGLAVSYSSQTESVCTISGSTVSILSAGSCMIEASQAGDANYMAAPAVTQAITIDQASQTITFPPQADQTYSSGGTFAIDPPATASSGLAITYASQTTSVCTINGSTVSILAGGSCMVEASQPGDANYTAAQPVTQAITIDQASQTVTFPPQADQTYSSGGTFAIDPPATASSGLAVAYASLTTDRCTVSDSTVTMIAAGICTIEASQPGDANYAAATAVSQDIFITQVQLSLGIDNGRAFARYGQTLDYVVTLGNSGNATAHDVSVSSVLSAGLDVAHAHWVCLDGGSGATCTANGVEALADTVTLPAGRSLTWIVTVPVSVDASDATVTMEVAATGAASVSDVDTLVIFREGFDVPDGDGAGVVEAGMLGGDSSLAFSLPSANGELIDTVKVVRGGDIAIHVDRITLDRVDHVRLSLHPHKGVEHASAWARVAAGATLSIAIVAGPDGQNAVLLEGADESLMVSY
ncbi:MAG: choice-of-anchor J domain-containing protein [Xanthomonadales bacterium]|nr:choice-of-anchor J domain-containing protein [Xanthomonadales bacterium]